MLSSAEQVGVLEVGFCAAVHLSFGEIELDNSREINRTPAD